MAEEKRVFKYDRGAAGPTQALGEFRRLIMSAALRNLHGDVGGQATKLYGQTKGFGAGKAFRDAI